MSRIKSLSNALTTGWDFYVLRETINDHGEKEVVNALADVLHRGGMPYTQAAHQAATLVEYSQPGRTEIFREVRDRLDFGGDPAPVTP